VEHEAVNSLGLV